VSAGCVPQCRASSLRLPLRRNRLAADRAGAWGLIDAAHLIPYAETQNNDPRNGMALTPTFHER
jgi:hypothetical protein